MMEFSDWLTRKYIEWRGDAIGNDRSISEFARLFKMKQPTLSQLMSGSRSPGTRTIKKIAEVYPEVYKVVDLPMEESPFEGLPADFVSDLKAALEESKERITKTGVSGDSPEAVRIIHEVMGKYGFSRSSNSTPDE